MLHPPIRVVVTFAVPLVAAAGLTAVSISRGGDAPESIGSPVLPESELHDHADVLQVEVPDVESRAATWSPAQFSFVIRVAGASYIRLSDDAVSPRAKAKLVAEDGVQTAIARLSADEVPEALREWRDREVIVGGTCRARVVGFALIARLTGDPGYAGDDKPWTAASVMEHGEPVIAAKLDGCAGGWARDASLSHSAAGDKVSSSALVAAARVDLFAGELANQTQAAWRAAGLAGDWRTEVPITALAARHPVTNDRWVVLHAKYGGGCGDHEVNILAVYRENADGSVTRISARQVELDSIEQLVDVDGDGTFEVIATEAWGLNHTLIDVHGNSLTTLPLQFYGCPC